MSSSKESALLEPSVAVGLNHWARVLSGVGWFIPPFVQMGVLGKMVHAIDQAGGNYGQDDLERDLEGIYSSTNLAVMVTLRYPQASVLKDYARTIEEAAEAHVLGLDHVAVAGLIPVIEGAGRQLAALHGIEEKHVKSVFCALIDACKAHAVAKQLGAVDEVVSMLDSFATFTGQYLYTSSVGYPLSDKTNRHGIAHGAYADLDYGRPLNFFKTIAAVDFLTFVSTFTSGGSWFAPSATPRTLFLAQNWLEQRERRAQRLDAPMSRQHELELRNIRSLKDHLGKVPLDEHLLY